AEVLYAKGDFEDALVLYYRGLQRRPELEGFSVGVGKATEAIRAAVGGLDVGRLKAQRDKLKKNGVGAGGGGYSMSNLRVGKTVERQSVGSDAVQSKLAGKPRVFDKDPNARNLLEELYDDLSFLQELHSDGKFMKSCEGEIRGMVEEALGYLETRTEFWRQRNPNGVSAGVGETHVVKSKKVGPGSGGAKKAASTAMLEKKEKEGKQMSSVRQMEAEVASKGAVGGSKANVARVK
ncbi:Tetratricopeptide repeat protein 25, partial [Chytridiales sp. JEL 0842]